ncbi:hypothetical protein GCM10009092_14630 [Bowmanella denitrificans]|uniref:Carrier domain-containing protein n=1 Tax=Bowmanella denitrificans TaxID=366582 RepID=A0ABN0WZR3_9ALTE
MDMDTELDIAITGLACRFPDASDAQTFWRNIFEGHESIRTLSDEELQEAGIDKAVLADPDYVNSGSFLDDIDQFDAALFGYSAKEADLMDPQHRLFLQTAWEALESCGHAPDNTPLRIGVYAGCSGSSYLSDALSGQGLSAEQIRDLCYENNSDLMASRVAYKLNLKGPAVTLGTACSTSLVVIHQACQALIAGECDMAIAGAARVSVPQKSGYHYAQGGILSRDGKCRAFDAGASGTISGSGAGAIILRPLDQALMDGDPIFAVIKGSAINNDGARKLGFTAPSVDGQADVITQALNAANVQPQSIGYVEAHGTATALGDPIEVKALTKAYRQYTAETGFCAIGSVKANIGHLDTAAGMAGIIKLCGAFARKQLPPSINYSRANPEIDFASSPFFVNTQPGDWERVPRRAAASAFGIGGTNAHVILQEPPVQESSAWARHVQLLCFSANSQSALQENMARFARHLAEHKPLSLPDAAYTLHVGRTLLPYRASLTAADVNQALQKLNEPGMRDIQRTLSKQSHSKLAMMFSGQGAQYVSMGASLYDTEPEFRAILDQCARLAAPHLQGYDLLTLMFDKTSENAERLTDTAFAQPCLFALEYALAMFLQSLGVKAQTFIGHSLGEYVAACLCGVFTLSQAIELVCLRGRLMAKMAPGRMLAVQADEHFLLPFCCADVVIAARNSPASLVLAGPAPALEEVAERLQQQDVDCRWLKTSHAFHSPMMEPCLAEYGAALDSMTLCPPTRPFISNLSGQWASPRDVCQSAYWTAHLRHSVNFSQGVATLLAEGYQLLEVGPGKALATLAAMQLEPGAGTVPYCLPGAKEQVSDFEQIASAVGALWRHGVNVDWSRFYQGQQRRRVALPTYAFEQGRYWLRRSASNSVRNEHSRQPLHNWFYRATWQRNELPPASARLDGDILCLVDTPRRWQGLLDNLVSQGLRVTLVYSGRAFSQKGQSLFSINPGHYGDFEALSAELVRQGRVPSMILHTWAFGRQSGQAQLQDHTFHSLLYLAKALSSHAAEQKMAMLILTRQLFAPDGHEPCDASQALVLGPCRVIAREFDMLSCRVLDLPGERAMAEHSNRQAVVRELLHWQTQNWAQCPHVAIRQAKRYMEEYQAVNLQPVDNQSPYRQGGCYLISGGFGGIGATLARHLCKAYQAKVILLSRRALPPQSKWQSWLDSHDEQESITRNIRLMQELRESGGHPVAVDVDVSDFKALKKAMGVVVRQTGPVHGIFHSAGIADGALIQSRQALESQQVFSAKVMGSQALLTLFRNSTLDFFVLCSSLSAQIGPVGQVAYCAANAYQQVLAQQYAAQLPIKSIGWDSWREVGMAVDSLRAQRGDKEDALEAIRHGILPEEGIEVVQRVLAYDYPDVAISTRPLAQVYAGQDSAESRADDEDVHSQYHGRPDLASEFQAPAGELQERLARLWQDRFGIAPIGVKDDFFELHGHSLMAVQIVTDIKRHFAVTLPSGVLYEHPTIASLALLLEQRLAAQGDGVTSVNKTTIRL